MTPYFSIIIPCLNEEHFLPHLLKNLDSQTFTDFEVIVIDGHSDDQTPQIVKNFPAKYSLSLHSTPTRNVAFQRNLGAQLAAGKVLIFFDADTQIPKNYLKKVAQVFEKKHPHFLTTYIKVDSRAPSEKMFAVFSNLVFEAGKAFKTPFSFGAMQAVKKGAFFDVGGYDENTKFSEDSQLFQNLLDYNYKYLILSSPTYTFSLRRFRSEGVLKSLVQSLQLNFNILLNGYHVPPKVKYEMGGGQYDIEKIKSSKYPQIFEPLLSKLIKSSKKPNRNFQTILDRLFSSK
jgi:glycosyltransferase involved in cell wall biosynthesis